MAEAALDRDADGRLAKGRAKTGGRKKGSLNKTTTALKDALMASFDEVGGAQYLLDLAKSDPKTYCGLLAKLIPAELKLEGTGDDLPLLILRDYTGGKGGGGRDEVDASDLVERD